MAILATNVKWGSSPTNTFDFSVEAQRNGSSQAYKITVSCDPCTGSSYFGYPIYLTIKLDGFTWGKITLKSASPSQWSSAIRYTTDWLEVQNKTSGTTNLDIRIYSGSGSSRDTTYSYSLAVTPAASKIRATDANIESTSTISITKYDAGFNTTVSYKAAGQSGYTPIWTNEKISSFGWTVPSSLYSLIPNAKEIEVTLLCQTYNGSAFVGSDTCTMTATTNAAKCAPDVTVTAVDTNEATIALTGNNKKIIKGFSNVEVTTTPTVKNSAYIYGVRVSCGSVAKDGLDTIFTFDHAQSATIESTVIDSRKYSSSATTNGLTLINYILPTIVESISRESPTSDIVNISVKGNWFNGSFGAKANSLKVQVRYKPKSQASYTDSDKYVDMTVTTSGNTYTAFVSIPGLVYTQAYSICIRACDAVCVYDGPLADPIYRNTEISKGIPVFDWGEDDFNFNVPVNINAGINIAPEDGIATIGETGINRTKLIYIAAQGITDGWTYRLWSDGLVELWCIIKAIHHNGSILGGEKKFPFALTGNIYGIATLNSAGGNSGAALPWNVKLVYNTELCGAWVHNNGSVGFAEDSTADVSVYIVGKWK